MSILQERVIKQLDNLTEDNLQFLLEIINRYMIPRENINSEGEKQLVAAGALKAYANPSLIDQEEGAWKRAVISKYAE